MESTAGMIGINCSLSDALDNVGRNLVYDPITKKLCFKSSSSTSNPSVNRIVHNNPNKNSDDNEDDPLICAKISQLTNELNGVTVKVIDDHDPRDDSVNKKIIFNNKNGLNVIVPSDPIKRPENLPPKPPDEERKHRQEFLELLQNVKRKDQKEKRLKRIFTLKQARQEAEIQKIIKIWIDEILPNWQTIYRTKRVQELWWHGIPSAIRPKIWNLVIRNELNVTEEMFHLFVKRSKEKIWTKINSPIDTPSVTPVHRRSSNPSSSSSSSPEFIKTHRRTSSQTFKSLDTITGKKRSIPLQSKEDVVDDDDGENVAFLIKLDVLRTFPQLGLFQENGPYHESLCDILSAYVIYRPDLGYCQGMSFLAAMLLLNTETPASAFIALANLLNNELLLAFYGLNQDRMQATYVYYDRQFNRLLPLLAKHFSTIGLTTDLFFMYQVYTIFARSLSFDCVCRVWDIFLRDGNEFIIRASLAILSMYQKELLQMEFIDSAKFLAKLPDDMDNEKFFEIISNIKLIGPIRLINVLTTNDSNDYSDQNGSSSSSSSSSSSKYSNFVKKILPF